MGFLLFLTTAVSTAEVDFLAWSLVWAAGGGYFLLRLEWERSSLPQGGTAPRTPLRAAPLWLAATVLLGAGFFVALPRLRSGVKSLPLGVQSLGGLRAGMSAVLDLSQEGPIRSGSGVVMRVVPEVPRPAFGEAWGLLRGLVLESLEGQRWEAVPSTPRRLTARWGTLPDGPGSPLRGDAFLEPDPGAVVPVPYGQVDLEPPEGEPLRSGGPGAPVRVAFPVRRILPIRMSVWPGVPEREPPPFGERLALLLEPGQGTECALRWSLRAAPGDLPPRELAERLAGALRNYRYTLDNPSGGKANPLEDFLERSRAGHCEYFASALAVMLRRRGVPARVVVGYRLGTWIGAGGYYLVAQNDAHSWVEYYDPALRGWRVADPTPPAPASGLDSGSFAAALGRLVDDLEFRWDRNVVRFSDEDQVAAFTWIQAAAARLGPGSLRPSPRLALGALGVLALAGLAWRLRRSPALPGAPGAVRELRPVLRAAGRDLPPLPGETARAWMDRLARARPDRSGPLGRLALETDAVAYGGKGSATLARLAREEAAAWRLYGPHNPDAGRPEPR
jgi:transglutaminase-like putative cysteine protease